MYYFCWAMFGISACGIITSAACLGVGIMMSIRYRFDEGVEWVIRGAIAAVVGSVCLKVGGMNTSCDECDWEYDVASPPGYCGGCGVAIAGNNEQRYECACGLIYNASYNYCTECGEPLLLSDSDIQTSSS